MIHLIETIDQRVQIGRALVTNDDLAAPTTVRLDLDPGGQTFGQAGLVTHDTCITFRPGLRLRRPALFVGTAHQRLGLAHGQPAFDHAGGDLSLSGGIQPQQGPGMAHFELAGPQPLGDIGHQIGQAQEVGYRSPRAPDSCGALGMGKTTFIDQTS